MSQSLSLWLVTLNPRNGGATSHKECDEVQKKLSIKNFARPAFEPLRKKNPAANGVTAIGNVGYVNTDSLYDSFSVAQAASFPTMTPMFQIPISGSKTRAQTNMQGQGVLVNQNTFALKRIRVIIAGNTYLADAINIGQLCSVKLLINGVQFIVQPVIGFPGGAGIQATAIGGTTTAGQLTTAVANGDNNYNNAFTFADEILIENNQQVEVDITAETAFSMTATASGGVGTTIYVFLDGRRLRSVA
jgi:hypothetical protein